MNKHYNIKLVGERLYKLRKENKYTQEQVSNYLNISQSNLSKIENGDRNLNITLLDKLCLLYNCTPKYLLRETNSYEKINISISCDGKVDLNAVAKMNQIMEDLKLLRNCLEDGKLEKEEVMR